MAAEAMFFIILKNLRAIWAKIRKQNYEYRRRFSKSSQTNYHNLRNLFCTFEEMRWLRASWFFATKIV